MPIAILGYPLLAATGAGVGTWIITHSWNQKHPHDQAQDAQTQADQAPSATASPPNCQNCDDDPNKKKDPNKGKKITQDRSNLQSKTEKYLLNPNANNQGKWKFYQQELGFNQSNWQGLADQLNFDQESAVFDRTDMRGIDYYDQNITLNGQNGSTANVKATFGVQDGQARLITASPD